MHRANLDVDIADGTLAQNWCPGLVTAFIIDTHSMGQRVGKAIKNLDMLKHLKKNDTNELIYRTETDSQI